ncbi:MAG: hypothetical protein F6K09_10100 [Merismopedia sp. SIO2A8]|nr:hypothetical protein [Symploca sp. SIO2B6]NET49056.1 hypothetical protein [Merismopedia sp. SIO2A8]
MTDDPSSPSLWDVKPWWCQPWSIILTGLAIPSVAWLVTHRLWLVTPIVLMILGWWTLFLYLVPKSYAQMSTQHGEVSPQQVD